MQLIPLKNFNIQTCFIQFLWFFRLRCWFKAQIISWIHLSQPNAYKLMCFDRNINGNRDVKFFECRDYWSLYWRKNLTLLKECRRSFFSWYGEIKTSSIIKFAHCVQHQQSNQVIMMLGKSTRGQRVRLNCYVFDTDRFLTDPDSPQSACDMDQLFLLPGKAFILSYSKEKQKTKT